MGKCVDGWMACPVSSGGVRTVEICVILFEYKVGGLEVG